MKRILALLLLGMMLFAAGAACAQEETGVVVQSSCSIVQSGDYYLVYCFAQVHNNSDQIICLDNGMLALVNGEQLLATADVAQLWPYFIGPGEDGYLFDIVPFEPNEDGVVVPTVTGLSYDIRYLTIDQAHGNMNLTASAVIEQDELTGETAVVCRITNPTDIDAYDPTVTFGLYMENGAMIYADGVTMQNVGIPAGGTVLQRFRLDNVFVNQWKSYNAMPTEARVTAVFRNDAD